MKVEANAMRSLRVWVSVNSAGFSTRSTLLSTSTLAERTSPSVRRIASSSSCRPLCASINSATISASWVEPQAVATMARSSRRPGEKIPGVSTKMSCATPSMAMPRTSVRVVCTFGVTIEILAPTSALANVDLPTLGAPISATKPQRVVGSAGAASSCGSAIAPFGLDALARQHGGGGGLLGGALGAAGAFGRRKIGQLHGDAKYRTVIGTGARDLAIGRRRQAARLRPFLQHGFGIAHRLRLRLYANLPQPLDQTLGRRIAAVEIDRADQRFADVGQDGRALAAASIGLRRAELDRSTELDGDGDLGAGLLAHQIGEPARQLAFVGFGEGAEQHVGNHQAEHMIAEELEPLIGAGAVARALERGNVGERAIEQRAVLEAVADALLEHGAAAAAARFFLAIAGRGLGSFGGGGLSGGRFSAAPTLRSPARGGGRSGGTFAAAAHLTSVNIRLQRTSQGQRQTSHTCVSPLIEKKMICALPMMFS